MSESNFHVLGRQVTYPDHYSPDILVVVPRDENRIKHHIDTQDLPFTGVDVWNAYEVSALTEKGIPVNFVLRLLYPCQSRYIIESKSLKLYLNSFNMSRCGDTPTDVATFLNATISRDLSERLHTNVRTVLERPLEAANHTLTAPPLPEGGNSTVWDYWGYEQLSPAPLTSYNEELSILEQGCTGGTLMGMTDLLRSRCKITSQPDWGDLYLYMSGRRLPSVDALLRYIVSFRNENHFHEEVVEMIYAALWRCFSPDELLIMAFYTRRGGIDINPVRANSEQLIERFCRHISQFGNLAIKTARQ